MSPQRTFPNNATSVAEARRYVLDALGTMDPALADAIAVMVSELTANAVRHAASHFTVSVDRTPVQIRVSVHDNGDGLPVVRAPEPVEPTGRGLRIVQALAADWGVLPAEGGQGKTVWFTVAAELEHTVERVSRERAGEGANLVERRDVTSSPRHEPPRSNGPGRGFVCRARRLPRRRRATVVGTA
jgi:two-component sensor histidine kinase